MEREGVHEEKGERAPVLGAAQEENSRVGTGLVQGSCRFSMKV